MKWNDDKTITITPPAKPKKITGTRFAAIMGLNKWTSPFNAWCAITRTYEEPFEDTIYTIAGKTIEPKQAEYMKTAYFMSNLITPTDVYGEDYFKKTWGDFFRDTPIFGGMWDYLLVDKEGKPQTVLEMKTTKRSEDWVEDVPEYYALQAALYAYLLGLKMSANMQKVVKQYEKDNDLVLQYLEEKCQKQDDVKTRAKTLYDNYKLWCKSNGYYVCSMKKFNAELMAHPEWYEQKSVSGGVAVYYGIMMKTTG